MTIDFELRKKNISMQLQRIVNVDSSSYNQQHIELLTNFMCRNNEITPIVIQDVLYGIEDYITSISSKLITGIYINENNDNDNNTDDDDTTSNDNNNENNDNDAL
ncbi:hypothetical protein PIROE2DRAFT_11967 [Piromyces sp. E2]|nr:hypothetical protein PIROE2DRAFT_11967 [Piromyces sp. E2]|eukprot:OUM61903.1 hypothetical protein PIROE2DRAFT_11967 [Piromyces sp. E2]